MPSLQLSIEFTLDTHVCKVNKFMKYIARYLSFQSRLLKESFHELLLEDRISKNMHKARAWIEKNHPEVIGRTLEDGSVETSQKILEKIRKMCANARLADCKFLLGVTRIYFDLQKDQSNLHSEMKRLSNILKVITTLHADEYDSNLRYFDKDTGKWSDPLTIDQLDAQIREEVDADLKADKEEVSKMRFAYNDYAIVPIDSFEEAKKYANDAPWCITYSKERYYKYTMDGWGRFYFCLKRGYKDVPEVMTEGFPMDTYGKSMFAIAVDEDGSLATCSCRWNTDEHIMDTEQISKFFGVNFYDVFKPYDDASRWKIMLKRNEPDKFSQMMGCARALNFNGTYEYGKMIDGKLVRIYAIDDRTMYIDGRFAALKDGKLVDAMPQKIGDYAFSECTSLESITIPSSVTSIGYRAFHYCSNLTSIIIPDSVESIGDYAFSGCKKLKSIVIPDSVKTIGRNAFSNCYSLKNIAISNQIDKIKMQTFCQCAIEEIVIPDSVKTIESCAFNSCQQLKRIVIPDSVESIGDWEFAGDENLKSIVIPDSVESIGDGAFEYCINLKSIVFKGKTLDEVQYMDHYPWGIKDKSAISAKL